MHPVSVFDACTAEFERMETRVLSWRDRSLGLAGDGEKSVISLVDMLSSSNSEVTDFLRKEAYLHCSETAKKHKRNSSSRGRDARVQALADSLMEAIKERDSRHASDAATKDRSMPQAQSSGR